METLPVEALRTMAVKNGAEQALPCSYFCGTKLGEDAIVAPSNQTKSTFQIKRKCILYPVVSQYGHKYMGGV